jgi:hypothetical protein
MQFEKQLPGDRSPLALARHRDGASRHSMYSTTDLGDRTLQASSEDDAPWRSTIAAASGLMVKAVGACAACGEVAFQSFLLTVTSWTIAQVLAGCAALGEAMYPSIVEPSGQIDRRQPAGEVQSTRPAIAIASEPSRRSSC